MCRGIAWRVVALMLCIAVVVITEEMHAFEGLASPLLESAKGLESANGVGHG